LGLSIFSEGRGKGSFSPANLVKNATTFGRIGCANQTYTRGVGEALVASRVSGGGKPLPYNPFLSDVRW